MYEAVATLFTPLVLLSGAGCLCAQCVLWLLFRFVLPKGPWRDEPGFTAHQVVCFPLMLYCAYTGVTTWFTQQEAFATPSARVFGIHDTGSRIAQILMGELIFWDTPTCLLVSTLREPVMVAHHVLMAVTAAFGLLGLWTYYGIFFFGVIEISGIPLAFVDVFHPKHEPWCSWLKTAPRISALNDALRGLFFLAYMAVRACWFPLVMLGGLVADAWAVIDLAEAKGYSRLTVAATPALGVLFVAMQWYWAVLLIKQVQKLLKKQD